MVYAPVIGDQQEHKNMPAADRLSRPVLRYGTNINTIKLEMLILVSHAGGQPRLQRRMSVAVPT